MDSLTEADDFWHSVINETKFDILKLSRRFNSKQPRTVKIYIPNTESTFLPEDARVVVAHVDRNHKPEVDLAPPRL